MDGTLVDTEPHWSEAQQALMTDFGLPRLTPEQEEGLVGSSAHDATRFFRGLGVPLEHDPILVRLNEHVADLVARELAWRPGAVELLRSVREAGIPTALVTNSDRSIVDAVLAWLPEGLFTTIVTSNDVRRGKPEPEPFLLAAERLGVEPGDCVVIEDSPTGLRAAVAAGCAAIGVPHGAMLDPDGPHTQFDSLAGVTLDMLREVAARHATVVAATAEASAPAAAPAAASDRTAPTKAERTTA